MRKVIATTNPNPGCSGSRFRAFRAFTLLEMLAVIGILAILLSVLLVSTRSIIASQARTIARQQLSLISAAIERYATFWPRWEAGGILVADRAWPDPFAIRVFDGTRFQPQPPFNTRDPVVIDGNGSGIIRPGNEGDRVVSSDGVGGDVMAANACLSYALLSPTGKGPYLSLDDAKLLIRRVSEVDGGSSLALLPAPLAGTGNAPAEVLVDPWGTPYRYFWVYRDANAYRGFLPVVTVNTASGLFRKAVGFVLESAGPDRKFGNVWQALIPTVQDRDEAADNLTLTP